MWVAVAAGELLALALDEESIKAQWQLCPAIIISAMTKTQVFLLLWLTTATYWLPYTIQNGGGGGCEQLSHGTTSKQYKKKSVTAWAG